MEPILIAGVWQPSKAVGQFRAADPATGEPIGPAFPISSQHDIELALTAATAASEALAATEPQRIADFLDAYAAAIDANRDSLVALAHAETALPATPRLAEIELPRTSGQLRQAAQAVRRSAWTQSVIDTAANLRAHFAPLGKPVLIFGPNNFPLAFNAVAGSDFASAIAARNAVIAKAHPAHPATSASLARLAQTAADACGLPTASIQLIHDLPPPLGLRLAGDRRLGAIGFTGSRAAGMALKAAADAAGIPIHAEMSSVNPVFLLDGALRERADALGAEFFNSCTLGSGQFCTNPGIVVVPANARGDTFVTSAGARFNAAAPMVLLTRSVQEHLDSAIRALCAAGARIRAGSAHASGPGWRYAPTLLEVDAENFLAHASELQQEAFGPAGLIVRTHDRAQAEAVARAFDGNLTASVHASADGSDDQALRAIAALLRPRVGRLIRDKWPTGVAVSPAMQHGGPYPSTSHAGYSAVGMPGAIRRFAQWQCHDGQRDEHLPPDLRNANPDRIQRLVDGVWTDRDLS